MTGLEAFVLGAASGSLAAVLAGFIAERVSVARYDRKRAQRASERQGRDTP